MQYESVIKDPGFYLAHLEQCSFRDTNTWVLWFSLRAAACWSALALMPASAVCDTGKPVRLYRIEDVSSTGIWLSGLKGQRILLLLCSFFGFQFLCL